MQNAIFCCKLSHFTDVLKTNLLVLLKLTFRAHMWQVKQNYILIAAMLAKQHKLLKADTEIYELKELCVRTRQLGESNESVMEKYILFSVYLTTNLSIKYASILF